ncbi:hypothetical protein DSUL_20164 [Desulfovibrionales bacterium]
MTIIHPIIYYYNLVILAFYTVDSNLETFAIDYLSAMADKPTVTFLSHNSLAYV